MLYSLRYFYEVLLNNIYNYFFYIQNNIKYYKSKKINFKNSKNYTTVWLLNLKESLKIFEKNIKNPQKYSFLDVGCGYGLPSLYVSKKNYIFKENIGFDVLKSNIIKAKKNNKNKINDQKIIFFNANAKTFKLKNKKYFIFLFNPFNEIILKKFLDNNVKILKKNKCFIAYINAHHFKIFKKYKFRKIIKMNNKKIFYILT